jgi:predicted nucleic acid-binding protein
VLVVDASVVVNACLADDLAAGLPSDRLIAPPLLWSEVSSVLHELRWRSAISVELVEIARARLKELKVDSDRPPSLLDRAWAIADRLGWAKTYDAEYLALAEIRDCPLVTIDERLRRAAGRVTRIIGPTEW